MKIGFLFNHDQIHQVAHSLPIALELARLRTGAAIILATTTPQIQTEVERLAGDAIGRSVRLHPLRLRRLSSRLLRRLGGKLLPASKLLVFRDNLDFFRSLDVLVVAEKTSLLLKTRYGLGKLKIVHTRHGAGDRAIGFDRASAAFDHVLVSGPKVRDRLVGESGLDPERISIVGYPKFDLFGDEKLPEPLFEGRRPVVVYNPHLSPHLSSWYAMGRQVLDWFVAHPEYQLIFAPHVMLFERPLVFTVDKLRVDRPGRLRKRVMEARNIHVDLGSRLSTTMAYMNAADIYLGDVSSQVYEFLIRPRPCVFLNPQRIAWQADPNFAVWAAGPVIERVEQLGPALGDAQSREQDVYAPVQRKLFDHSFDLGELPSSVRAAEAIAAFAGLRVRAG